MSIITEVRFAHENGALAHTIDALPDTDVTVVRNAETNPENSVYVIEFGGADLDAVEAALSADHTVGGVNPMPGFEQRQLVGVEFRPETELLNPTVTEAGGFVIEARGSTFAADAGGWHERWLLPDGDALRTIWQEALDAGFTFEVLELRRHGRAEAAFQGPEVLTDQQQEALEAACEGGYFAEPREMSLEELAEELDLSPSGAAGRLQRGMKSLIGATLVIDDETP